MSRALSLLAVLVLAVRGGLAQPVEDLFRGSDLGFLIEPLPQFPLEHAHGLERATLDLAAPPNWFGGPSVDISDVDDERTGLILSREVLQSLILEGSDAAAVEAMLAGLRAEKARRYRIDLIFVPPEALASTPQAIDENLDSAQLATVLERAGEAAIRLSVVASNGQTMHATTGRRRMTHTANQVNQTGVIPVVNQVIASVPLGFAVEVRPCSVGATPFVELALRAWKLAERSQAVKRSGHYSEREVVSFDERSLETKLLLPIGKAVCAGFFDDAGPDGKPRSFALLARVEAIGDPDLRPQGRTLLAANGLELRAFDVGFLARFLKRKHLEPQHLIERLQSDVEPKAWEETRASLLLSGSFLFATAPPATQAALADWLEKRLPEATPAVVLELQVLEGPVERLLELRRGADGGVFLAPGDPGAPAAKGLERTLHAVWRGWLDEESRFRGVQLRSYVRDLSISSGACFRMLDVPNEEIGFSGDGFDGRAVARAAATPGAIALSLEWTRSQTRFELQAPHRVYPLNGLLTIDLGGDSGRMPTGSAVIEKPVSYPIDLPEGDALRSQAHALLFLEQWAILKLESTTAGQGRLLIARARSSSPFGPIAGAAMCSRAPVALGSPMEGGPLALASMRNGAAFVAGIEEELRGESAAFVDPSDGPPEWESFEQHFVTPGDGSAAADFRRRLEEHGSRGVTVEVAFVSPGAVQAGAPGASPWLAADVFDQALLASRPATDFVQSCVPMGQRLRLLPRNLRRQVTDQEVLQTGLMPVVEPVVASLPDGLYVEAAVYSTPDEALLRIDLRADLHRLEAKLETRRLPEGDIGLASGSSRIFAGSILAPPRQTVVAGLVRTTAASGPDGFLLLVRLTPWRRAAEAAASPLADCLDARALIRPFPHSTVWDDVSVLEGWSSGLTWPSQDSEPGPVPTSVLDEAIRLAEESPGVNCGGPGGMILVAGREPQAAAGLRASLAASCKAVLRPFVVDLWEGAVSEAELDSLTRGTPASSLKAWLDRMGREGLRTQVLTTANADASIAAFAARAHVADLNRVSGGTGQAIIEVADVEVRTVSEGFALDLRCTPIAGMEAVQLSLRGELARRPKLERHSLARNPRVEAATRAATMPPTAATAAATDRPGEIPAWFQIDLPDEDTDRWRQIGIVPIGQPTLIQALPDPTDPRRLRALVAVVGEVKA